MRPYLPRAALAPRTPANKKQAVGVGVSTPCRYVPGGPPFSSPVCRELYMYVRILDPRMGPYPPRVVLAPRIPANHQSAIGVVVSTPCGAVSTRRTTVFVPGVLKSCRSMERFLIRGWNLILPGWRWLHSLRIPANIGVPGVGVSTPCASVSNRGTIGFVPGLL